MNFNVLLSKNILHQLVKIKKNLDKTVNISIQNPQKMALLEQNFQCVHVDVVS